MRRNPRATVAPARDDVVDGDPTLILESSWAPGSPSAAGQGALPYRTMQVALAFAWHGLRGHLLGGFQRLRDVPVHVRIDP